MAKKRKERDEIDNNIDKFKPIDPFSMGSDDDPCFGKLHDLNAAECKECGDSEFCMIVKAQNLKIERIDIESKHRFKDIEEADQVMLARKKDILIDLKSLKLTPHKRLKVVIMLAKKYSVNKSLVKELYEGA